MLMREPESMDELMYFTNRTLDDGGKIKAWAYKLECSKCHKSKMGKPVEKGHVKIRAKEYVCPACGYTEEKTEHENKAKMQVKYTCPKCKFEGEAEIPYVRKKFQGVDAFVFECQKCHEKIPITKKMKKIKGKESVPIEDDE